MSPISYVYLAVILVLLVFSNFFSMSDMVYSSASLPRLKQAASKKGRKRRKLAYSLALHYEETIVTLLFGNSLVNIAASSIGALFSIELVNAGYLPNESAALIVELAMLIVILIFGEVLPKAVGKAYSFPLASLLAYPVTFFQFLFFPFVKAGSFLGKTFTRPLIESVDDEEPPSDDELEAMLSKIEEEGIIDEDQEELLRNAVGFKETSAYEIMTPRVKIEGIEYGTSPVKYVLDKGAFAHSRIPVYQKSFDHILGYIPIKSLYRSMLKGENPGIDALMVPILSVPRTMEISSILRLMKRNHRHIAVVKDEFGGTEGILTLEDILEELVGEMWDESEAIKEDIVKTDKRNVYEVRGTTNIEEFFSYFELDEENHDEDYTTISGWIVDRLGRFAKKGDKIRYGKLDIEVIKTNPYSIEKVRVHYHPRRKIEEE